MEPPTCRQRFGDVYTRISNWETSVGPGVVEIRVRVEGAFRLMYVAKFAEGIYVLHVFQKKSQKTSGLDIEVARTRWAIFPTP